MAMARQRAGIPEFQRVKPSSFLHFEWGTSKTSLIGTGLFGDVFKGFNRESGEPVAVKIFKTTFDREVPQTQDRIRKTLLDLMNLHHENIVQILGVSTGRREDDYHHVSPSLAPMTLVMEYCGGGSLAKLLYEPENFYGFPDDDEYIRALRDILNGVDFLRSTCRVHRDLKPGNILVFESLDGQRTYKLTDFDTVLELKDVDEETLVSLRGTEEYLHPDLYEFWVTDGWGQKSMVTSSIDLWSLGVTFYQMATGSLPFTPYEVRSSRSRDILHRIHSEKAPGVISGKQLSRDGPITWSSTLPKTCGLSADLQTLIVPALAGMLERNPSRAWDFRKLMDWLENVWNRKRLEIFRVNQMSSFRLYLDTALTQTYSHLQDLIQNEFGIPPAAQILLFRDSRLITILGGLDGLTTSIPSTSKETPLILGEDDLEVSLTWRLKRLHFKPFNNMINIRTDEIDARYNAAVGYLAKREIEHILRTIRLLAYTVTTINQIVLSSIAGISRDTIQLKMIGKLLGGIFGWMKITSILLPENAQLLDQGQMEALKLKVDLVTSRASALELLQTRMESLDASISHFMSGIELRERGLIVDWENRIRNLPNPENRTKGLEKTTTNLVCSLQSQWGELRIGSEPPNEHAHRAARHAMMNTWRQLEHLPKDAHSELLKLRDHFSDWYKLAQVTYLKPKLLDDEIEEVRAGLYGLVPVVVETLQDFSGTLNACVSKNLLEESTTVSLGNGEGNLQVKVKKGVKPKVPHKVKESLNKLKKEIRDQQTLIHTLNNLMKGN